MYTQTLDITEIDVYRQIFNTMPIHIYMKDKNLHYVYCNLLQKKYFNLTNQDSVIGKNDYDFFPTTVANLIRKNDASVFNSKKPMLFEENIIDGANVEHCFISNKIPILDKEKKLVGVFGFSFDITELKKKEKKAKLEKEEIESTLNHIVNSLPEHVYWKDVNLSFKGCNIMQAKSAGFDEPSQLVGKNDFDMPWKNVAKQLREVDLLVISKKMDVTKEEVWCSDETGERLTFLSKKTPLLDKNGKVIGLIGVSFDITDRKNIEKELEAAKDEAEEANYLMTEFISNMGHDLATPISDVGSVAEVLKYYSDEYAEMQDLIKTLIERAAACEAVRKRIINATSISNLEVKKETFSIVDELLVLEKELRPLIGSKALKIILKPLKPKKEDFINTDRKKFHDILSDLISNAINFTEEGEVSISVFKKDNMFHIKVSDTGIGIPKDKFEYIFKQYTKLSRSNKHGAVFKGVGAGLYLARIRAHILNATISVESEVNKGSTFTLVIPR